MILGKAFYHDIYTKQQPLPISKKKTSQNAGQYTTIIRNE